MRHVTIKRMLSAAALGVVLGGSAAPASADVETAIWLAPEAWSYEIKYMPDFDQRRQGGNPPGGGDFVEGLPGLGNFYCVPTSAINIMAYIGRHGFPDVPPGDVSYFQWQGQSRYAQATDIIADMGEVMQTNPNEGTDGSNGYFGVNGWLFFGAFNQFDVDAWFLTPDFTPTLTSIGQAAINGALVQLGYGYHENAGQPFGLQALGEFTGGHAVTFARGSRFGSAQILGVRDPAADPDANTPGWRQTQSPFTTTYFDVTDVETFWCVDTDCSHMITYINYDPEADAVFPINGFLTVRPKSGYAFTEGGEVLIYTPAASNGWNIVPQQSAFLEVDSGYTDVELTPGGEGSYILVNDMIYSTVFNQPGATLVDAMPGGIDLAVGCDRLLYAAGENAILKLNPVLAERLVDSVFTGTTIAAIAYDDAQRRIVALGLFDREFEFFDARTMAPIGGADIPGSIPVGSEGGVMVEPPSVGEVIWFYSNEEDTVWGVHPNNPDVLESIDPPGSAAICGIDMDDNGRMYISTEDGLHEYERSGPFSWTPVSEGDRRYPNTPACAFFKTSRSQTNWDPTFHKDPGWFTNIDPDLLPVGVNVVDCNADLDDDGVVGSADLAILLAAWGPDPAGAADFDGDDVVNAADLAILLAAWGPCA